MTVILTCPNTERDYFVLELRALEDRRDRAVSALKQLCKRRYSRKVHLDHVIRILDGRAL